MLFPDRATLFVMGIEDRQYKDEKISCKFSPIIMQHIFKERCSQIKD